MPRRNHDLENLRFETRLPRRHPRTREPAGFHLGLAGIRPDPLVPGNRIRLGLPAIQTRCASCLRILERLRRGSPGHERFPYGPAVDPGRRDERLRRAGCHGRSAFDCRYLRRKDIYNATCKLYITVTGKQLIKLFEGQGWKLDRVRGSHHIMVKPGRSAIPVPVHGNRELPVGTFSAILKQAGLKKE